MNEYPFFLSFSYWQELGYLIVYITGRPDVQKESVLSFLGAHGFPLGKSTNQWQCRFRLEYRTGLLDSALINLYKIMQCAMRTFLMLTMTYIWTP